MRNAFEVLGLTPEATSEEIYKAFRERAAQLEQSDDIEDIIELEAVQEAYESINTPAKQTEYRAKGLVQPKETDLPALLTVLRINAPNCALVASPEQRPVWTLPRLVASSRILIKLPTLTLKRGVYEFVLDRQNHNLGWVKLNLMRKYPSLFIDFTNPRNILAAIMLTKALGGIGFKIPNNLKPETEAEIRKLSLTHGLQVSTYPVLRLAAQKSLAEKLEEQRKSTHLIPQLVPRHPHQK